MHSVVWAKIWSFVNKMRISLDRHNLFKLTSANVYQKLSDRQQRLADYHVDMDGCMRNKSMSFNFKIVHAFFGTREASIFVWNNALVPIKLLHQSNSPYCLFLSALIDFSLLTYALRLVFPVAPVLSHSCSISHLFKELSANSSGHSDDTCLNVGTQPSAWIVAAPAHQECVKRWPSSHAPEQNTLTILHCSAVSGCESHIAMFFCTVFTPLKETMAIQAVTQAQQHWQIQLAVTSMACKEPT